MKSRRQVVKDRVVELREAVAPGKGELREVAATEVAGDIMSLRHVVKDLSWNCVKQACT